MSSSGVIGDRWVACLFRGLLAVVLLGAVAAIALAQESKPGEEKSPPAAKEKQADEKEQAEKEKAEQEKAEQEKAEKEKAEKEAAEKKGDSEDDGAREDKAKQIQGRLDELQKGMTELFDQLADDPENADLQKKLEGVSAEFNRLSREHMELMGGADKPDGDLDVAKRRALESIKKGQSGDGPSAKPTVKSGLKPVGKGGAPLVGNSAKESPTGTSPGILKPDPKDRGRLQTSPVGSRRGPPAGKPTTPPLPGGAIKPGAGAVAAPNGAGESPVVADEGSSKSLVTSAKTEMHSIVFDMTTDSPESRTYRFQYVETPWVDVLKDFARVSGLPPIDISDFLIPEPLTYYSTETFTFKEALHKLNELLLMRPLNNYVIQIKDADYLSVQRLPDLIRKIPPERMFDSFEQFEAANLDPYDVCQTQFVTPDGWMPFQIIEEFRPKFSDTYGTQIIGERTLELTGLVREHHLFKEVIGKLTRQHIKPRSDDDRPMQVFKLKSVRAADAQNLLRQLYPVSGPAPVRGGKRGPAASVDPATEEAKRLTIVPDIQNNWLYVKGPRFLLEEIAGAIESLDGDAWIPPEQEILQLENASAGSIVGLLRPIFQAQAADIARSTSWIAPEVKDALVCDMHPNVSSNAIILIGARSAIDRAKRLIASYDVPTDWINEIIEVKHADAEELANEIISALPPTIAAAAPSPPLGKGARPMQRIPAGPQTRITAMSGRKLLVSCPRQDYAQVLELVAKFDVPNEDEPKEHFMQLEHAVPSDIMSTVARMVEGSTSSAPPPQRAVAQQAGKGVPVRRPPQARPQIAGATGGGPVFIPDDAAAMLIVFCSDHDWPRIEELVRELDALAGNVKPILRSVKLQNADAADIARALNQMFPPSGEVPQIVTADAHNNTVDMFAIPSFVEKVLPLIAKLDVDRRADRVVIHLTFSKAEVIAPILQQIFTGPARAQPARQPQPVGRGQRPQPVQPQPPQPTRSGTGEVRIVAEPITNSLIVTASPSDLDELKSHVAAMEEEAENKQVTRVIVDAVNQPAADIASMLTTLVGGGLPTQRGVPQVKGQPAAPRRASSVNPVAEPLKIHAMGERIVLDGPRDEVGEALELIKEIDVLVERPIMRKIKVPDAEDAEEKLLKMMALRGAPAKPPVQQAAARGQPQPARPVAAAAGESSVQIYADTYENVLLVRAMPKDFQEISEILEVILSEEIIDLGGPGEESDDFYLVKLRYKTAWDMAFTLGDLVNEDGRPKVQFLDGPTEKELLVRNFKPGQKEQIDRYIAMFDVPSGPGGNMLILDESEKMQPEQLLQLIQQNFHPEDGTKIQLVDLGGATGRVQVIDIHADDDAKKAERAAPGVSPCVLPASLVRSLGALSLGQALANRPIALPNNENACPVCGQNPCVLPGRIMSSLDVLALASVDDPPVDGATEDGAPAARSAPAGDDDAASRRVEEALGDSESLREGGAARAEVRGSEEAPPAQPVAEEHNHVDVAAALGAAGPNASALAEMVSGDVKAMIDPLTGKLILVGPPDKLEMIQDIINELTSGKAPTVIRVFPLRYSDVTAAARLLTDVFNQPQAAAQPQRGGQPPHRQGEPAGTGGQAGAKPPPPPQQRAAPVPKARIKVVPDERTQSLFVVAPLSDIPLVIEVLRTYDTPMDIKQTIKIFRLKHLDAGLVTQNLREILGLTGGGRAAPGGRPMAGGQQPGRPQQQLQMQGAAEGTTVSADKVKLTAESQTNAIIAQAPPETLGLIETLIEDLEMQDVGTAPTMRRVQLQHARATEVAPLAGNIARSLDNTVDIATSSGPPGRGRPQSGGGRAGAVSVNADARTNSVIIAGQSKDVDQVEAIIRDLDIPPKEGAIKQYVVRGEARALVDTLKSMFDVAGSGSDIVIVASEATNTVLVKAPPSQMAEIEGQLLKLDEKMEASVALRTIVLEFADAEAVGRELSTLFGSGSSGARRGGGAGGKVAISGVKSNNTLYVRCPDDMFEEIQTVALGMDKTGSMQVKRFPLEFASAQDVHQKIQTLMAESARSGNTAKLDFVGLVPDPRTNSLILTGGPISMLLMDQLLAQVDVKEAAPITARPVAYEFPKTVDVDQVARNINDMFRGVSPQATGVEAPKVTANSAASVVIVTANTKQHEDIKASIIDPILANVGEELQDYQVKLEHARADEVSPIIEAFMRQWWEARGRKPQDKFAITADPVSHTLLINCAPHVKAVFDKQLATMDGPNVGYETERTHKAYALKFVDPRTVQQTLSQMFPVRHNQPLRDQVSVSVDSNTSTVIVLANEGNQTQVDALIAEMDKQGEAGEKTDHIYKVQHAEATQLARTLTDHIRATMPRVRNQYPINVIASEAGNLLIVNATQPDYDTLTPTIEELDKPGGERIRRVFKTKYVSPWQMAAIINQQFQVRGANPHEQVTASFDDGTFSMIVTANEENMQKVADLIEQTDLPADEKITKFIQLKEARADELARSITEALRGKVSANRRGQFPFTIQGDVTSNKLIATAPTELFADIEAMVANMDVPAAGADEIQRRIFKLTFADPGSVSRTVRELFRPPGRNPAPRDMVTSSDDWTTNSVIVSASAESMTEIEALIADMDKPGSAQRSHHVIEVANANVNDVAQTLQQVFDAANRGRRSQSGAAMIRAIRGTTKLAVYANDEELETITSLVEKVDVEGGRMIRTVTMTEDVPAQSVADQVNNLFGSGGRGEDGPRAEVHGPTNTLIVRATEPEFEKIVKQIIEPLQNVPATNKLNLYKIKLEYAVADEVAQTLQEFFDRRAGVQRGFGGFGGGRRGGGESTQRLDDQVTITAEASSNMLLVNATESTKAVIDDLLVDIDSADDGKIVEMVPVQHMDATEMLEVLTEFLKVSQRTKEDTRPWWARDTPLSDEKAVLAGGMRLKAIESMNAITVVGKPEGVANAMARIKELDQPQEGVDPQVYAFGSARASEIAEILKETFGADPRGPSGGRSGAAATKPLTIVPVAATNSIVVDGKKSEVTRVLAMAQTLDRTISEEGQGGIRVIPVPANQNLDELAQKVEEMVNAAEQTSGRRGGGRDSTADLVTITAHRRASALIVAASKSKFAEVEKLIAELVAMGPAGNIVSVPVETGRVPIQQIKDLIQQMREDEDSSGSSRGSSRGGSNRNRSGGRRSDANWTQNRRYEGVGQTGMEAKRIGRRMVASASAPVFMMHVALSCAVAQTSDDAQPPKKRGPVISKIRPREEAPTTQPADKPKARKASVSTPGGQPGRGQPASRPSGVDKLPPAARALVETQMGQPTTQPADMPSWSPSAREAMRLRLSGANVEITEAGPGLVVIEGTEEDVAVIQALIKILGQQVPDRQVEYIRLENASAEDLARTLQQVFDKLKPQGGEPLPKDQVDIIADKRTNGLYIAATEEKMAFALELARTADVKPKEETMSYEFKNRRVSEVGEVLKRIASTYLQRRGLPATQIGIEIDAFSNTVFVTAGKADLGFVRTAAEQLDVEIPEGEEGDEGAMGTSDIMVVPLRIARADTLATLLNELLERAATGQTPMQDFIRRFRLLDERGEPIATVNLNRPIFVGGEPDSNALIIASSKKNCLIMKQVALAFDIEPSKMPVESRVFTLKYADATELAGKIDELLTGSESLTQRPGMSESKGVPESEAGALVYKAVVKADARTNQLVVVGRPEAVSVMAGLIESLDVHGQGIMPFDIVKLEYASATGLATALAEMMDERKATVTGGENVEKNETVIIKADARANALIIAAKRERMEELRELITKLDVKAIELIENIRAITLKTGNAVDLSEKLKDLWQQRRDQREGGTGGLNLEIPAIVADLRSNSLIVAASPSDFEAIKSVVDKIENLPLNPMVDLYIVRLDYNSASQLSGPLQNLFEQRAQMSTPTGESRPEDKVTIEVDEVTNSLLVAASKVNYDLLVEKVKALDVETGVMGQIEFFDCKNVTASRVKDVLDEIFQEGPYKPGSTGGGEIAQERERVTTVVDTRANSVIVSASPENMEVARNIYNRMNSVTEPWDVAITRMITLQYADPVVIAAQVEDHFQKLEDIRGTEGDAGGGRPFGVTIISDERRSRVIIGGTKDGIDSAVQLIAKLDVAPTTHSHLTKVYTLREAPADKVGEMIRNVFEARREQRGDTGPQVPDITVTVEPNEASQILLIDASRMDHVLIEELIAELDRPTAILAKVGVFQLTKATAQRVKEILDEVYGGSQADGGQNVVVVEDKRTNSVVVAAPPGELENVAQLVTQLDTVEIDGTVDLGIFFCENEDANKMAELLREIMTGEGGDSGGAAEDEEVRALKTFLLKYNAKNTDGSHKVHQVVRENVQIAYNERTNSVIVVAPPASLELIKQLVRQLDSVQKREVMVKVFMLRHADATRLVELLTDMFAQDEGSEAEQEFQRGREINVEGGGSGIGDMPTAMSQGDTTQKGTFGRPRTSFVADERTNSVIVAGWPEDVGVAADIIDQLDSREMRNREPTVYTVVNHEAEDLQAALQGYFDSETQIYNTIEGVSPHEQLEQEVSVVAHPESNQLIIATSPRLQSEVLRIVEMLDMAPPQVMIEVMIAEVTIDDRFEMGLEFALQELRFSETAVPGPNGILQSSHFDVIGGTDLGAGGGTGLGGFSFTITGEDFNFLVRALQTDSRLEVIQKPKIMCQDNQAANITIGSRVPIVQSTSVSDSGQVLSQVTYEEVGIILDVEPNINPDGYVYLRVAPEISAITGSNVPIGNGIFAPIFSERSAETTVAVKDGETVVIGGLITTSENESESKVPLLGDIPGVGNLFRTTTRTKTKTELLIALTPTIVRTVEDARRMSVKHRDGSGIITRNMKQSPLFDGLRVTPDSEDEIDSIENVPETVEPMDPSQEVVPIEVGPKKQYGPEAPRYGPSVASDVSAPVARRSARSDPGLYVSLETAGSSREDAETPQYDVGTHR